MTLTADLLDLRTLLLTASYALPRILGLFVMLPFFNRQIFPGMIQIAVAFGLAMVLLPIVVPVVPRGPVDPIALAGTIVKEVFIGVAIGFVGAVIFWAVQAVGAFIDNQRGSGMASSVDPMSQSDTSPVGILLYQAFLVYFLVSGAFMAFLTLVYDSYRIWPIDSFVPQFRIDDTSFYLGQLDQLMHLTVLLSAPVVIAMFLSEFGMALVSRFAPQLNVFFLAMPIKSGVGLLVLVVYAKLLFGYLGDQVSTLPELFDRLRDVVQ
jgi:type III secretion protein T